MAAKILHYCRSYVLILGMSLRSRMSFRLNFFVMLLGVFLREFANLALMIVVVQRFEGLSGWSMWEMAFLYCIVTFTFRNYSSFFGGVSQISKLIRSGEMDVYMLTPLDPLFLINSRNTMIWRMFYNIGILALLVYCGIMAGVKFTLFGIISFLSMMLSSMVILSSLYLIVSTLAIFVIDVSALEHVLNELVKKYMIYPINIYGLAASFVFTFIIPIGFVAYYPGAYMLDKTQQLTFNPMLGVLTPVIAAFWAAAALLFWRFGVRNYKSTGT